ncbi:hypothetical protein MD588_09710 [Photobacterium sp. SDRW27]|uniref:hypothetical protein n=1 Tax=Photobacterium obscurum TaxID=2829490 RepID=UPI0022434586|nr:hypothetical protein [Photobacterium obscurum]MCW8329081.1 hypothetical protein [Photobacterium obscurum]
MKKQTLLLGGTELPVYMLENGEYRWSMRQASLAVGYNEGWLADTTRSAKGVLTKLRAYGFIGNIQSYRSGSVESHLIKTEDLMAMVCYAAFIGERKPAIALLAASMHETFERRADREFGVVRDEDERALKFELRFASILLNKELKMAISIWIDDAKHNGTYDGYLKLNKIRGGERGVYASALGQIYQRAFAMKKAEINHLLGAKSHKTPKDILDTLHLRRVANIEEMANHRILNKGDSPLQAINNVADFMGLIPENPRGGDRITSDEIRRFMKK